MADLDDLVISQCPQSQLEQIVASEVLEVSKAKGELTEAILTRSQKRKLEALRSRFALPEWQQSDYPLDANHIEPASKRTLQPKNKSKKKNPSRPVLLTSSTSSHQLPDLDHDGVVVDPTDSALLCPRYLWDTLFPFQREGVCFLWKSYRKRSGALLADDMGLGKTLQSIAFVACLHFSGILTLPVLIVCPTTLQSHWKSQFAKFYPEIPVKSLSADEPSEVAVFLCSYEFVRSAGSEIRWGCVIADEVQRVRNPSTDTSEKMKLLKSEIRIGLSGSPIQNNLRELWSVFDFIAPGRLGNLSTFEENLASPVERGCRPNATASAAQAAYRCAILIRDLTLPLMLRRLKSEVSQWLKLPGREEQVLFCHLAKEQFLLYREFVHTQVDKKFSRTAERAHAFFCLSVLRKISNHPDLLLDERNDVSDFGAPSRSGKLKVLLSLLRKWKSEGRRALVFSQTVTMLDVIEEMVIAEGLSCRRMDGSTPLNERDDVISDFSLQSQSEVAPFCLLLTTRVGGVGLNLQGADRVVIFDPDWNPMIDAQARERAWRIGQDRDVVIYRLVSAGTVEELIYRRQLHKHFLAQRILSDPRQQASEIWMDLHSDLLRVPPAPPGFVDDKVIVKLPRSVVKGEVVENDQLPENDVSRASELLSAVFDQKAAEQVSVNSVFVDPREAEEAARKAIAALGIDKEEISMKWQSGAEKSKALIASIKRGKPESETASFQTEKDIAAGILNFFKSKKSATTQQVLDAFRGKIDENLAFTFRSCLKQLCDLSAGVWELKQNS